MKFGAISGLKIYTETTCTGWNYPELDEMINARTYRVINRYKCSYCKVWVNDENGVCNHCGAPLPGKPTLIEP